MSFTCVISVIVLSVAAEILAESWDKTCQKPDYTRKDETTFTVSRIEDHQIKFYVMTLDFQLQELTFYSNWKKLGCGDKTVIIYHGYGENSTKPWVNLLQQVFVEQYSICAVACDYHYASHTNYITSILRGDSRIIASKSTKMILSVMADAGGVSISKGLRLVGFSWGAHIVGMIGNLLRSTRNQKPYSIFGLDPAGPLFDHSPRFHHLSPDDAECVTVYYTSRIFGTKRIDLGIRNILWGQCGRNQWSVCKGDYSCDHVTSHEYFIHALENPSLYQARRCASCPYMRYNEFDQFNEFFHCDSELVPVIKESCSPETLYILPQGCVPPSL